MPGLRSLVARRRSAIGSPSDGSVSTPPPSQQNSPCSEECSPAAEEEECSSSKQLEVNGGAGKESEEATHRKDEKSNHSEVIVSTQEKESSEKVSGISSDTSDGKYCDMVNGSGSSVDQGANDVFKQAQKLETGNVSNKEQVTVSDGSSVMSSKANDNECPTGKGGSDGLMAQMRGGGSHGNRSAMEIESTLAKRGVTIVRRLVNCKDQVKPKTETPQMCVKDSLVLNGTVITANPQNAEKNIESRLGRIASSLKGTSITLNSRGLLGLRGGATINRNPVGRPPNNLRDINQRGTFRSRGIPSHPGPRGLRHQTAGGFSSQPNVKLTPSQIRPRGNLRPSFPLNRNFPQNVNSKCPEIDIRRLSTVSSQKTTPSMSITGPLQRGPIPKGSSAFPSPKRPGDYVDPRKAPPYNSPRRGFAQAGSPPSWPGAAGSRTFTQQQRSITPSPLRGTVPSPQSRSSAMSPQSNSTTSPPSSAISPRSNSSIPSPQSKVTSNYQARSADASPYSRTQEVSPVSRSAELSPQSRAPELSPSSRSTEVSPLSRTSELSPLSRSVEASPQHRPTGITPQTRYPVGFSPQSRAAELSPSSRPGTLGSHSLSSPPGVSPQPHMLGLSAQSMPIGVPTVPPISTGSVHTDTVGMPPQSTMGLLAQPTNSVGLTQGSLPFVQPQQNNARLPGPVGSIGYTGLANSSADSYISGGTSNKFPVQPNLEGFPSQVTAGGFPLHSNPGGFPSQPDLPGYPGASPACGFPPGTSGGQFPTQSSVGIPDQLNPDAFGSQPSCTNFNQASSGYPPHSSSGGYGLTSSTNEFHERTQNTLGYPSPRNFPVHANAQDYPTYTNSENTAQEISSHTSPRELSASTEVLQNCSQGLPVHPPARDSINSVGQESQVHSNYNDALLHSGYHEQNTFPRSNPADLQTLPDFRDPSHDYREPNLMTPYRPDTIPNNFRETPLHNSPRTSQPVSDYRDLSVMPGINDIPPQASPRGPALHNNYKEQSVQNAYREHSMIGSFVESPALANYREPVNQADQREQPLPSFRETVSHASPREHVLPGFGETMGPAGCREQLLSGYRETMDHTSPREQAPSSFNENLNHNSPRSDGLPGFGETLNLRPQVLPSFDETVAHPSPRMQSHPSYRESVDYSNYRDPLDQSNMAESSLHSQMRNTVQYNCDYAGTARQNHVMEPSHNNYTDFRGNTQPMDTNNVPAENTDSRNPFTKSVLPSFTESFECGSSSEYRKDSSMLHNFAETASFVATRRNSECTRSDSRPSFLCAQTYSPDGAHNSNSQSLQNVNEEPNEANSQELLLTDAKVPTSDNTNEAVTDSYTKYSPMYPRAENMSDCGSSIRGSTDSLEKCGETNPSTSVESAENFCLASGTNSSELKCQNKGTGKEAELPTSGESAGYVSLPSSPNKYTTVGSPSKLSPGLSPSSQERIVIKMKLLHSEARLESEKHKKGDIDDQTNTHSEHRDPSVKYTRWTIDSIINGRESEADDEGPSRENGDDQCTSDEEEEDKSASKATPTSSETPTNLDTNKNLMKPLKITIPNPLKSRNPNGVTGETSSPCTSRVTRRSSRLEAETPKEKHEYPIRKLRVKNLRLAPSSLSISSHTVENHTSPVRASIESYKKRRRRRSRQNSELSEASVSSVTSVLSDDNDQSVVAHMKKCSIVIKRIYTSGNNSCYSSSLCSRKSTEKREKPCTRPKRKAALEASERCHKSLRSNDKNEVKSNKIPYKGAFYKSRPVMSVNLTANNAEIKNNIITQCSVMLYDVFMNRRINSMTCPGCSRNYDSSDSVQVNISKATISLLCSVCQWLVVKDVHPHEVHSVAAS